MHLGDGEPGQDVAGHHAASGRDSEPADGAPGVQTRLARYYLNSVICKIVKTSLLIDPT